jgi:hypothetical protein
MVLRTRKEPEMIDYPLNEQKLIYRVLQKHLTEHPELMDCRFLDDLQQNLQTAAVAEGVDVTNHQVWDGWLGNDVVACDVRLANRRVV